MGGKGGGGPDYAQMEQMQQRQFARMQSQTQEQMARAEAKEAERESSRLAREKAAKEAEERKKAEIETELLKRDESVGRNLALSLGGMRSWSPVDIPELGITAQNVDDLKEENVKLGVK